MSWSRARAGQSSVFHEGRDPPEPVGPQPLGSAHLSRRCAASALARAAATRRAWRRRRSQRRTWGPGRGDGEE